MGTPVFSTWPTLGALLKRVLVDDSGDLRIRQVQAKKDWRLINRAMTPKTFLHDACREFSRKDSEDGPLANEPSRVCP